MTRWGFSKANMRSCPEKGWTNGTTSYDSMQPILKRTTSDTQNLPFPLIMQYHINTVDVFKSLKNIYHMLQEQSKHDRIL
jgi:hypothetical protein